MAGSIDWTLHTAHFTLHTAHCTMHTAHCTLYTAHSTLNRCNLVAGLQTESCKILKGCCFYAGCWSRAWKYQLDALAEKLHFSFFLLLISTIWQFYLRKCYFRFENSLKLLKLGTAGYNPVSSKGSQVEDYKNWRVDITLTSTKHWFVTLVVSNFFFLFIK